MKVRLPASIILALIAFSSTASVVPGAASTLTGETSTFTLVDSPLYCVNQIPNGCFATTGMVYSNYRNNLNVSAVGIVYLVVHNANGQTVGYGATLIQPGPGANETAFPIVFNLAPGTYNSTLFVIDSTGVAVSNSTTVGFTVTP